MAWLWIALGVLATFGLLVLVLTMLGRRLPEGHETTALLRLAKPAEAVFAALTDTAGIPAWDRGVDRVERLEARDGRETWRWTMGRNRMVLTTTVNEAPRRLVRTIADEAHFFSGDWTYEIAADGGATSVTLTEHGRVHVAFARALMHYLPRVADPSQYLVRHLTRLAEHFGETAKVEVQPRRLVA